MGHEVKQAQIELRLGYFIPGNAVKPPDSVPVKNTPYNRPNCRNAAGMPLSQWLPIALQLKHFSQPV